MESETALATLSALSHPLRLAAFRALVAAEPRGLPAGGIAQALERPANTVSAALAILSRAGLVIAERRGRQVIYRAVVAQVGLLSDWLVRDCCGGHPDACSPGGAPCAA